MVRRRFAESVPWKIHSFKLINVVLRLHNEAEKEVIVGIVLQSELRERALLQRIKGEIRSIANVRVVSIGL